MGPRAAAWVDELASSDHLVNQAHSHAPEGVRSSDGNRSSRMGGLEGSPMSVKPRTSSWRFGDGSNTAGSRCALQTSFAAVPFQYDDVPIPAALSSMIRVTRSSTSPSPVSNTRC